MKAALLAAMAAALLALGVSAPAASGGAVPWSRYLAPPSACPGADLTLTSKRLQRRAMACLVNWTRAHVGARRLRWSAMLADAAGSKVDVIVGCRDFSHHPCGLRWPSLSTRRGSFHVWGENLYYGASSATTPRAAMLAWLVSPEHRAVLFARRWSDLGITVRRVHAFGSETVSIWVLEVAGR